MAAPLRTSECCAGRAARAKHHERARRHPTRKRFAAIVS
jgi:hypothetical protein